jgi:2'-5' RNA ligase
VRVFVALDLDEALRREVADAAGGIRRAFERASAGARASWTSAARMHITLHFLGDVGEVQARAVTAAFRRPLSVAPFRLDVGAPGMFPAHGRPRVLWLGVSASDGVLPRLHRATAERLGSAGIAVGSEPFNPHLTIARLRSPVRAAVAAAAFEGAPRRIGACRVDAVTLYESRLGGSSPSYVALASAPLAGSST